MPIRKADAVPYKSFPFGVDNSSTIGSDETRGSLSKADNADIVSSSIIKKRNGCIVIGSAWSTKRIRGGFEYKKQDGTTEILKSGESATPTGTSGILGRHNADGTTTTILSNLPDGIKPTFLQFRNLCFVFTGSTDFIYDGYTTYQIGIDAPSTAPTFNSFIPGDLNTTGAYLGAYTYYNSSTGAESSPSLPSAQVTTGSSTSLDGIRWNVTPGNPATADKIRFYRNTSGGAVFFLDGEVAITATTYDSTVRDGGLGDELELDNSRPPGPANVAILHDSRIFLFTPQNPNRMYYSKIGRTGPMPQSFQAADFTDCNINDGDRLVGIGVINNTVIGCKERSAGRLIEIQASATGIARTGGIKYLWEAISGEDSECVSHHTIVSINNKLYWFGKDDLYFTDGLTIGRAGHRIIETIKTLNFTQSYKFSVINKGRTQQLVWSVCRNGQQEPDFQIIGHYRDPKVLAFTFYTPGTNTTTHPGLRIASLFTVTENKTTQYYFGSSNNDGLMYKMDTGTSDNGLGIFFDVRFAWQAGNFEAAEKLFHSYYTFAAGDGGNYLLTHTFEENGVETVVATETSSLVTSGSATWATVNWLAFNWAAVQFKPVRFYPQRKAYLGRYGFSQIDADAPIAIRGLAEIIQPQEVHR